MIESGEFDFSSVLESMSTAGVFAVDRRLNVIFWNRFMEIHSKLKSEEIKGQTGLGCELNSASAFRL